jgi:hypothetical protein
MAAAGMPVTSTSGGADEPSRSRTIRLSSSVV